MAAGTSSREAQTAAFTGIAMSGSMVSQFEAPIALVAKHDGIGYSELLDAGQEPRPGIRSQITVVDYDRDGKLDVLLGDFCSNLHIKPGLTAGQRQKLQEVRKKQDAIGEQNRQGMQELQKRYAEMMKGIPKSEWYTDEHGKVVQAVPG